jgi:hypothetical protein
MKIVIETSREEVEAALEVLYNTINKDPNERFWRMVEVLGPSLINQYASWLESKEKRSHQTTEEGKTDG